MSGGTATGGTFNVSGAATLIFSVGYTLDLTSQITGAGNATFNSGATAIDGAYTLTGATTLIGGVTSFNSASPVNLPVLNLNGGKIGRASCRESTEGSEPCVS